MAQHEEQDGIKEFVALAEEEHRIAEAYFGETAASAPSEVQVPLIGEFRYIPDPEAPAMPNTDSDSHSGAGDRPGHRPSNSFN